MRGRVFVALLLVGIALAWALDVQGYVLFPGGLAEWWPSIIILLGLAQLVLSRGAWRGPAIVVLVGVALQVWELDVLPPRAWRYLGPVALLVLALVLLLPAKSPTPPWTEHAREDSRRSHGAGSDAAIFSSVRADVPSVEYKGGELTAVFGSLDADFSRAKLPPEGARLKVTSVFGGVRIRVPAEWRVEVHGTPVAGKWTNTTRSPPEGPVLRVEATPVFGNVEIGN